MKQYAGQCHCGEIRFRFEAEEITTAMRCSCSICRRRSAYLSNFVLEPERLTFAPGAGQTDVYQFGTHVAKHHFCGNCGIFTHVETRLNPGCSRVNLGCVEGLDIFSLEIEFFDGDSI